MTDIDHIPCTVDIRRVAHKLYENNQALTYTNEVMKTEKV